ncbi:hypothetical protein [Streptomyces sp. NPDC059003]|uniref:hypothetical protein n=1 Tax=Streptomyces sp. NPDC059003 TaxID=3346691 RepID=UPI0036BFD55D
MMAVKRGHGTWQHQDAFQPVGAARELAWHAPAGPVAGSRSSVPSVMDAPPPCPETSAWHPATNLSRPASPRETRSRHAAADLAEVVRLYGLRRWIEQSYKHVKDELGWADFQVRSDTAIRRHQTLVTGPFSFCWNTWFSPGPPAPAESRPRGSQVTGTTGGALLLGMAAVAVQLDELQADGHTVIRG